MNIVERGQGEPLVVVPGVQGRWEWLSGAVDALARDYRVVTFSLGDEPSAACSHDRGRGMDAFADQIDAVLADRGIHRAALCGISFGGLVALRYAASRPTRVSALALVSAPGPGWHLKPRHEFYASHPRVFGPLFAAEALIRLRREIVTAHPTLSSQLRFGVGHLRTVIGAPTSVTRMAARARLIASHDREADCRAIVCPTLVMHGDPALDHVVDAGGTRDYTTRIQGATLAVLERTGHLGFTTRPREFANIVHGFLERTSRNSHDSAA